MAINAPSVGKSLLFDRQKLHGENDGGLFYSLPSYEFTLV
jgi:hypothetical protein